MAQQSVGQWSKSSAEEGKTRQSVKFDIASVFMGDMEGSVNR